ncbi:hypothetical protein EDC01DRAFT_782588 [Geopyxis carbonaria]|nr:hypothetical protein EDC01DRAFT_782588 [Geopyxis carbonaria]
MDSNGPDPSANAPGIAASIIPSATNRANSSLRNLEDAMLSLQSDVTLDTTEVLSRAAWHHALKSEVQALENSKAELDNEVAELRANKAGLLSSVAQTHEYHRRLSALFQGQLGARWRENFLFEQQRQAQEAQLTTREAALIWREEAVAAAEARLNAHTRTLAGTSSFRREAGREADSGGAS